VVDVEPTPAWFLPGPSNVVHVTVPCTLWQLSGSGAANNAGAERATTTKAATVHIVSFLIIFLL